MSRKFSLQRVLDFKEQVEDLLQMEVAEIEGRRMAIQHTLDAMRHKWDATSSEVNKQQPLDPAAIEAASDYLAVLDQRIQESGHSLEQVHEELESKRGELTTAYQEREMLKRLKARQNAKEAKAEQRRDTRAMEEAATSQYIRRESDDDRPETQTKTGTR